MNHRFLECAGVALLLLVHAGNATGASTPKDAGTEEFGMSHKELVAAVEKVEGLIAQCMRAQGFEYIAADYDTVRRGMTADKNLPGVSETEFIEKYGFGVSTFYTGRPPQLETGYSPAKLGLGERNVAVYKGLSPADQVAYTRALFGQNPDATFATSLEQENFARVGGCTRKGVEQVFKPDQLAASYYNPKDAQINQDPRMKAALRKYADRMRKQGFDYSHPDQVEADVRKRLDVLTQGQSIPAEKLSPEQRKALADLQNYERRVAKKNMDMVEELIEPVEEQIAKEMFTRAGNKTGRP
ncbi:MAG: hypothetical protein V4858_02165 [Pseudomonadota bacterium]